MTDSDIPFSKPYWPLLRIFGDVIDLSHLEPFTLTCATGARDEALQINVRFSNHCFTEEFDESRHAGDLVVMDHKRKRAFDRFRYDLSKNLPDAIQLLPEVRVHQTFEQRNYVYAASITGLEGRI